jgi:hypothetical protein
MSLEENFHHAVKQANIALGLAIAAAAFIRSRHHSNGRFLSCRFGGIY